MLFLLALTVVGLGIGILSGLLGIGGGLLLVPVLVATGTTAHTAVGTSLVAVSLSAISGSLQNFKGGRLNPQTLILLATPACFTSFLGVWLAKLFPQAYLLLAFAAFLLFMQYLTQLQLHLKAQVNYNGTVVPLTKVATAQILATGGLSGCLAGLFGIGGGAIMVPLQMIILKSDIKTAVVNSLGAIIPTGLLGLLGHALNQDVLWPQGLALDLGGLVGAQVGSRILPALPDKIVRWMFQTLLLGLAAYMAYRGYQALG